MLSHCHQSHNFRENEFVQEKTLDGLFTGEEQMNSQHESPFKFFFMPLSLFFFQLSRSRHAPEPNHTTSTQIVTQILMNTQGTPLYLELNHFPCHAALQLSFHPHATIRVNKQSLRYCMHPDQSTKGWLCNWTYFSMRATKLTRATKDTFRPSLTTLACAQTFNIQRSTT